MKALKFLLIILVMTIFFMTQGFFNEASARSEITNEIQNRTDAVYTNDDYSTERVYSLGTWWIYVYDEDGILVDMYPE